MPVVSYTARTWCWSSIVNWRCCLCCRCYRVVIALSKHLVSFAESGKHASVSCPGRSEGLFCDYSPRRNCSVCSKNLPGALITSFLFFIPASSGEPFTGHPNCKLGFEDKFNHISLHFPVLQVGSFTCPSFTSPNRSDDDSLLFAALLSHANGCLVQNSLFVARRLFAPLGPLMLSIV